MGQDRSLLYVRQEEILFLEEWPFETSPLAERWEIQNKVPHSIHIIYFCGRLYPCIQVYPTGNYADFEKPASIFCYNPESIDKVCKSRLSNKEYLKFANSPNVSSMISSFFDIKLIPPTLQAEVCPVWIASCSSHSKYHKNTGELTRNPLLKNYDFAKIKDPYSAFQELSMWFGNLAAPEKPIPQLSNEDLAWSKGHGDKYSFRKAPTKKRK